jgi:phosphoribosylanthranilate isomerase
LVTYVKVCGITCVEDLELAIASGADAVGLNLIPASKRHVDAASAARLAAAAGDRAVVVGVVADLAVGELRALQTAAQLQLLQLHGSEQPEVLAAILPHGYKAVRIGGPEDVALARQYGGEQILVDAKVAGQLGGTGQSFDWRLVQDLAQQRRVVLAGGLTAQNVVRAVREVKPWGVDVASGVEVDGEPRRKDPGRLRRFIERVREASAQRPDPGGING